MLPILNRINNILDSNSPQTYVLAFDQLHDIIKDGENEVNSLIRQRKERKEIKDEGQARKSCVGNIFAYSVIYIFLKNKEIGLINPEIYITNKVSEIAGFEVISTIKMADGEQQKPDFDLIIYKNTNLSNYPKCIILSLRTSLRERAAQTYKWKLLLEIANDTQSQVREKYGITYDAPELPLICFATVNFYKEINNPQQRGMLKFFDRAFLARELDDTDGDFIVLLSTLVDFVNSHFT
jgi:type II restriction enzyme